MTFAVSGLSAEARLRLMANKQKMRLPHNASCTDCGEDNRWKLRPPQLGEPSVVRCWQCHAIAIGRRPWEEHHLGGKDTHLPPVPIGANLHYICSRIQNAAWRTRGPHLSGSGAAITIDIATLYVLILLIGP